MDQIIWSIAQKKKKKIKDDGSRFLEPSLLFLVFFFLFFFFLLSFFFFFFLHRIAPSPPISPFDSTSPPSCSLPRPLNPSPSTPSQICICDGLHCRATIADGSLICDEVHHRWKLHMRWTSSQMRDPSAIVALRWRPSAYAMETIAEVF
ncbi:hypothetical protein ACOSQ4_004848 [Xanthoceras sorbifolium]